MIKHLMLPIALRMLLCFAVVVGTIPGLGCSHPQRESADRANALAESVHANPQQTAQAAAAEIARLLRLLEDPRIDEVGDVVDENTGESRTFTKIREDFYFDRHTMALCQNYLTLARANTLMGANEAAQRTLQQAIDAANKFVGGHIQYVMDSEPEVFRTIKAYFRAKKVETVAYVQLRDLARQAGNEALAAVYDIKARYAKMYLDSPLAAQEQETVTDWERQSSLQDDDRFIADTWLVMGLVLVVGLLIFVAVYLFRGFRGVEQLLGVAAAVAVGAVLVGVMIHAYLEAQSSIRASGLRALSDLSSFVDRVRDIPELNNMPSFEEFRRSVEESQRLAAAGDNVGAARAFLQSYLHLSETESELERLRERYRSSSEGTTAQSPS